MSVTCELTLSEDVVHVLGWRKGDIERSVKQELAVHFFQRNLLSFGQARQLAELSVAEFIDLLRERKIPLHYGMSDYEEDLKTIQEFI
jgi:predicted HTH domain antitoxin